MGLGKIGAVCVLGEWRGITLKNKKKSMARQNELFVEGIILFSTRFTPK